MKRIKLSGAVAAGMVAGALAWAAGSTPAPDSYAKIEAASLVSSPQNAWARAILFTDVLETVPMGRVQRLDRKNYLAMKLKAAGTAWVPEDMASKFQKLTPGETYSFAGTVDQISRRYYIIVDACYLIQTSDDLKEHWTDMLNPPEAGGTALPMDVSETVMQALLVQAQSRLIQLAQENNTTVAQLIEAQTDGGHRIAEHIVADALQGELKSQNQTAEEMMVEAVLALLQKESVLQESAKIAEENQALPPALPEPPPEATPVAPAEVAAVPETEPVASSETPAAGEPPPVMPEAKVEEPVVAVVEEVPSPTPPEAVPQVVEPAVAVVEEPLDIVALEKTKQFNGTYHVLGGAISPIDGIGPEQLHLNELAERISKDEVREIIIATNASVEGESTALYLQRFLRENGFNNLIISRLARGIPVGVDLEYADQITLSHALEGRRSL